MAPEPKAADAAAFATLTELLLHRAAGQADDPAYIVLSDRGHEEASITYGELAVRAAVMARRLAARAAPGDRALLVCPNGLDFMVGFLGCLLAGIIAVPMMVPRRQSARDAANSIVADCTPRLALAPSGLIAGQRGDVVGRFAGAGLEWLAIDEAETSDAAPSSNPAPDPDAIAFLQYTSGSTSAPKGVMVSQAGLMANLGMIRIAFGNTSHSAYVSWVPLYHDMGLVINALQGLYLGARCVLMAPVGFMQRPWVWLRAISEYGAEVAGAPNFAFDLCVERYRPEQMQGVDLSGWKLAFNGAEPVRADTIRRFAETFAPHGFSAAAMYPAYGMAEATVLISAGRRGSGPQIGSVSRSGLQHHIAGPATEAGDAQDVVGSGQALAGSRIAIVDPESRQRLPAGQVGEIWAAGPHIARGYWCNPAASDAAFRARITGEDENIWLRTGDLGFMDAAGELFVTGRIKEILIIRGANHYPQDIEHTVQSCHPALRAHGGAAFTVSDSQAAEKLVVVQEIARTYRKDIVPDEIVARIREAIVNEHEIVPHAIALLRPGALPQTTSGKIQRSLSRQLWLAGSLDRL